MITSAPKNKTDGDEIPNRKNNISRRINNMASDEFVDLMMGKIVS